MHELLDRHSPITAEAASAPARAQPLLGKRAALWIAAALALAALLIFAAGRYTNIDFALADMAFDEVTGTFPWRESWLTVTFSHRILKAGLILLALAVMAAAAFDAIWPQPVLDAGLARLRLRVVAWSALLVPSVISLLKQGSDAYCPWDLARYGGDAPYVRLFEALPAGVLPGHCFPAGHASSALWLVSLVVLWLPGDPRRAWRVWSQAMGFGLAVGWMQQMRGAHFLSHTLWSAWVACALVLAIVVLLQAVQAGAGRRAAPAVQAQAEGENR
ncbi:phosphatase PAP2 family protein [Massilia sp. GCM10023247]|uniref:phosphatase PAP2 family protein n=1 Tax=Massilia sp. GCM10023247 TaxID=3252643 RepID=UPI00361A4994